MADIAVVECAPRDGLRVSRKGILPLEKAKFIDDLSMTGVQKIQAVAFVHPKLLPQLGDAEEVMRLVRKKPEVEYIGLAANEVACRRAVLTQIDTLQVLVACSETYNKSALGYSLKDMINKILPSITQVAKHEGKNIRAYLLTAFGCPYEGTIPLSKIREIFSRLDYLGVDEICLVDSTGMATPKSVKEIILGLIEMNLSAGIAAHFHDTRGIGLANVMAAFDSGITTFDTSLGGSGETAIGAPDHAIDSWNIPTEDLVNLFEAMGVNTGIRLDSLLGSISLIERMTDNTSKGHILKAGPNHRIFEQRNSLNLF